MAPLLPTLTLDGKSGSENDESDPTTDVEGHGGAPSTLLNATNPTLFHIIKHQWSILALLVSESKLYAGTQNGDLLVYLRMKTEHIMKGADNGNVWSIETY